MSVFAGTRGEKVDCAGREYRAEERNTFRGVEVTPEKLVDFGMFAGACTAADAENSDGGGLWGLSPGIRLGVATAEAEGRCTISDAEMLWDSLLDGPCGRPRSFLEASWVSEARFTGLCGADALLNSRRVGAGAAVSVGASNPAL